MASETIHLEWKDIDEQLSFLFQNQELCDVDFPIIFRHDYTLPFLKTKIKNLNTEFENFNKITQQKRFRGIGPRIMEDLLQLDEENLNRIQELCKVYISYDQCYDLIDDIPNFFHELKNSSWGIFEKKRNIKLKNTIDKRNIKILKQKEIYNNLQRIDILSPEKELLMRKRNDVLTLAKLSEKLSLEEKEIIEQIKMQEKNTQRLLRQVNANCKDKLMGKKLKKQMAQIRLMEKLNLYKIEMRFCEFKIIIFSFLKIKISHDGKKIFEVEINILEKSVKEEICWNFWKACFIRPQVKTWIGKLKRIIDLQPILHELSISLNRIEELVYNLTNNPLNIAIEPSLENEFMVYVEHGNEMVSFISCLESLDYVQFYITCPSLNISKHKFSSENLFHVLEEFKILHAQ